MKEMYHAMKRLKMTIKLRRVLLTCMLLQNKNLSTWIVKNKSKYSPYMCKDKPTQIDKKQKTVAKSWQSSFDLVQ